MMLQYFHAYKVQAVSVKFDTIASIKGRSRALFINRYRLRSYILNYVLKEIFHDHVGNATRGCRLDSTDQQPRWDIASTINCVSPNFVSLQQQVT